MLYLNFKSFLHFVSYKKTFKKDVIEYKYNLSVCVCLTAKPLDFS